MFEQLNEGQITKAASYVYVDDYVKTFIFSERFLKGNRQKHPFWNLSNQEIFERDGQKYVSAVVEVTNATDLLKTALIESSVRQIENNKFKIEQQLYTIKDGIKLGFNLGIDKFFDENQYKVRKISTDEQTTAHYILDGKKVKIEDIPVLSKPINKYTFEIIVFDENGTYKKGKISAKFLSEELDKYFFTSFDIIQRMGIIVVLVVGVFVIFWTVGSTFLFNKEPVLAGIMLLCGILGIIYMGYSR